MATPPSWIDDLCQKLSTPQKLEEEYNTLRKVDMIPPAERSRKFSSALDPNNNTKNRYVNILPNEDTMVRLQGGGYINANFIPGAVLGGIPYSYIMTQGPLPNTIGDFWTMVWEQGVQCIVQLNHDTEHVASGQSKGYIHTMALPGTELRLVVDATNLGPWDGTSVLYQRNVQLCFRDQTRPITHIQFYGWPDHGVPNACDGVLALMEKVEGIASPEKPLLVHCSAGVGRTGTFITFHAATQLARRGQLVASLSPTMAAAASEPSLFSIQKIVEVLKGMRTGTVQGKDQYYFIYKSVAQWLNTTLHTLKPPPHTS
eukprot:PhF_6_TR4215/c0_g1_i1/m.5678